MLREKFIPTKIQTGVTKGEAGYQLVQPGGQLAVHVHPSWTSEVPQPAEHVRGPGGKHGGELVW